MPERSRTPNTKPRLPAVQYGWRGKYREGEIIFRMLGWRVRFYAGHSYVDRPRINVWAGYGSRGIVLRRHPGVARQPVLGIQWRRLDG